jgi:parallel beta-helix repeat protein
MSARLRLGRMLARAAALGLLVVALLVLWSSPALADQVTCGDTITKDTTLDNDLIDCPGDGIIIGADRITLDLNGHTVAGRFDSSFCTFDGCPHQTGIDNTGHDRVVIKNGVVLSFETGVRIEEANLNRLLDLGVGRYVVFPNPPYNVHSTGIYFLHSDRNQMLRTTANLGDPAILLSASDRNTISDSSIFGGIARDNGDGIDLAEGSDRNRLTHSTVDADGYGFAIADSSRNVLEANDARGRYGNALYQADRNVIAGNLLNGGRLVALDLGGDGNVVRNNTTSFCRYYGYGVRGDSNVVEGNVTSRCAIVVFSGDANIMRANSISNGGDDYSGDGLRIEAGSTNTLVEDNVATRRADGIHVEAPGTLVRGNIVNYNRDYGIEAVEGVIDGGGNRASGNGNPLQCLNIVCN